MLHALFNLKTNKLRSFLTTLGVVIGVTTIISVVSLIQGLNTTVAGQIARLGSGVITVAKYSYTELAGVDMEEIRDRKNLTISDARAIEKMGMVEGVAPSLVFTTGKRVEYEREELKRTTISGVSSSYFDIQDYSIKDGRAITDADVIHAQRVVCIGDYVAYELFGEIDPIGRNVKIDGHRFRVIGILEEMGSLLGQNLDNTAIIPLSTAQRLFKLGSGHGTGFLDALQIDVKVRDPGRMDEAVDKIRGLLRRRRGVSFDDPDDFGINTPEMLMELYEGITNVAFIVMIGISSIALVVGGVGIMNIMLVSVTERTKEIGIRRAIGAQKRDILLQFLMEAVILSLGGGLIGIILGFSIAELIALISPLPSVVSWWAIILGFAFSSVVGIFFGIYPAQKAAGLNPVEALRFE